MLIISGRPDVRQYVRRYHRASGVRSERSRSIVSKHSGQFSLRKRSET